MGQEHQKMGNYQARIYVSPNRRRKKTEHPRLPCGLKNVGQGFLVEKFLNQVTHQWSSLSHRNEPALVSLSYSILGKSGWKMVSAQTWQWISEPSSWNTLSVLPTIAGGLQVMLLVKSALQPAKKLVQEMRLNSISILLSMFNCLDLNNNPHLKHI